MQSAQWVLRGSEVTSRYRALDDSQAAPQTQTGAQEDYCSGSRCGIISNLLRSRDRNWKHRQRERIKEPYQQLAAVPIHGQDEMGSVKTRDQARLVKEVAKTVPRIEQRLC